jgi:hypothetical protein
MEYDTLGGVCANVEGHGPIADLTISDGHALMLAQGLGPGCDHEGLHVAPRIGRVPKQPPTKGTVTQADPTQGTHGAGKRPRLLRSVARSPAS